MALRKSVPHFFTSIAVVKTILKHLHLKLNRQGALSLSYFTFIAVQSVPTVTQNDLDQVTTHWGLAKSDKTISYSTSLITFLITFGSG